MSSSNKILFVLTSHGFFLDGKMPTGWYLPEAAHPYYAVTSAGYEVDWASPTGGKTPLDPVSVEMFKDEESVRFLNDPAMQHAVQNTLKLSEVDEKDYNSVFFVGGAGPVFDVSQDVDSIRITEALFARGRPVAAVCHGPAALVNVKAPNGNSIFVGRSATAFSNEEEEAIHLTSAIPFLVEDAIKAKGGKFVKERQAWGVEVIVDDSSVSTLITGANPASAGETGKALVAALKKLE